ncbi:pullulanase-type alpha-1,6-glucosidase [Dactylosporangium sp. NPDC000555]|uniref:pullulanase-type alpha-1,6-glucosidase n=1 Tax=Dactylosporangium sp. NPDC000555 TaxID=3154260 RepID=UPI003328007E
MPSARSVTSTKIALGILTALAVFTAAPGENPRTPDVPQRPTGYSEGVPEWVKEPSVASILDGPRPQHAEQFYFVLADRFADGDPTNNTGGLSGNRLSTGYDPTDKGFYHGGDLKGVIDKLDYIQGLGTTAIWLAPVFKNRPVQGSGNDISAGYHGYWITDFTQIDPHFGTRDDLKRLTKLAHQRGIKIYLDVITNHTADVIRYAQNQYSYRSKADYPYKDANGNKFDDRDYADGTRGFPPVNAQSFPYTPVFASEADKKVKQPAWLNDPTMYHNRGDSTFSGENAEYGDFFGLDDLWTERPEVVQGMTKIYSDWVKDSDIDGYRIDTARHVDMQFWPQFTQGVQAAADKAKKPGFFMFGEVYDANPAFDSTYVRKGRLPATLDFPFQQAAADFVARGGSGQELADLYAQDDLYTSAGTSAQYLPTFLGNHDMGRIGYFVAAGGTDPATHLRRDELGHELMFLTRGQPVVYSGDEQGFTGSGGDKDARQDMFASRTADYLDDDLLGTDSTHAVSHYDTSHPIYRTIASLARLRAKNPALRQGVQITRYADQNVFAFSRIDPDQRVEYVVASNNGAGTKTITVPTYMATTTFDQIYPSSGPIAATAGDGSLQLSIPPLTTVVLKARGAIKRAAARPAISLRVDPAPATTAEVRANVTGDPLSTVTFAARVGNGAWKLLGTDHAGPYAAYHDLDGLAAGTKLEYKAVVRDGSGRTAEAKIETRVGTPPSAAPVDYAIVHYQRPAGDYSDWGLYAWGDIQEPMSWPAGAPFAGEDSYGRFAWVKLKPGAANVGFLVVDANGVKDVAADRSLDPTKHPEIWLKQGDATIYTSQAAATGSVSVHYGRPDGDYTGWGLHLWGDGLAPGSATDWASPRPPDGVDDFGAYWHVPVSDPAKPVNFIAHKGDVKDPGPDQSVLPRTQGEAWIRSGEAAVHPTRAAAEHTAVLHYRRPGGDYDGWGLHVWTGAATGTDWGSPLMPSGTDAFGVRFTVPLAGNAPLLNYIMHKGDTKDLPTDQTLDLVTIGHEVWILSGQEKYLLPIPAQGTPDTDVNKAKAVWIDRGTVAWRAGPTDGHSYELWSAPAGGLQVVDGQVVGNGTKLAMSAVPGGLTEAQRAKFPHLWAYRTFRLDGDRAALTAALRGQVVAVERDASGQVTEATGVQLAGALDDLYSAALSAKLGPAFDGQRPTISVWAPTAQQLTLELYQDIAKNPDVVAMTRDDRTGVWSVTGDKSWKGRFYKFRVTAYQPAVRAVTTASVTDPYSVSLSANGTHSQIADLSDPGLRPSGWSDLRKPPVPSRPQIQELSVRDFSIADTTVPAEQRGTYLAFTQSGSAGMRHLRQLAQAGTSYVHLLPVFDVATIPEVRSDQAQPPCDLAALPPDSSQQQACVAQVADRDGYNWGYDPFHYNAPEGSYATDPQGTPRITQFRQMVAGLNNAGLRVVMDVVYNHTTAAGTDQYSVLDQIVPGYYQRLLDDGTVANSTCCANTAPENAMMGKLVVDSIVQWAKQYKVDGFRFDLMGHHPKANILAVRAALDQLTAPRDGVDGKKILLYGEGWNFGEVADNARFVQATQANMAGTGVATFNDRLRDAVRGGAPFDGNPRVQGFATGLYTDPNGDPANGTAAEQRARLLHYQDLIQVGLTGNLAAYEFTDSAGHRVTGAQVDYNGSPAGYTRSPSEAVTYVDAHDNEILYDAMAYKLPAGTTADQRARLQVLALSTTVFGQGAGFVTAGSDRLRSKSLDRNSFNSGDWFNQIRWDCADGNGFGAGLPPAADNRDKWQYAQPLLADPALVPDCAAIDLASARFQELLSIRASSPVFALSSAAQVQQRLSFPLAGAQVTPGVITMVLDARGLDGRLKSVVVVFNAGATATTQTVASYRGAHMALHPVQAASVDPVARQSTFDTTHGSFTVPARTVAVFVQAA